MNKEKKLKLSVLKLMELKDFAVVFSLLAKSNSKHIKAMAEKLLLETLNDMDKALHKEVGS